MAELGGQPLKSVLGPESREQAEDRVLGTSQSQIDPFPKSVENKLTNPDYLAREGERIMEALRQARPSGLNQLRPPNIVVAQDSRAQEWNSGVSRPPRQPAFPPDDASVAQTVQQTGFSPNISFLLQDATTVSGDPPVTIHKVLVFDGKINGTFPAGMGTGNYVLTIPEDVLAATAIIYAGITFDPQTLLENSWFLDVKKPADVPESRVEDLTHGFLYWQIGFAYNTAPVPPAIVGDFTIWQTLFGDINFAFSYGNYNNKPALLPVTSAPGWIDLDAIL